MATQAIGIDIGTHAVKVAQLQRKGATTRAVRLFRATLGGDTDAARLKGALARAGMRGGPGLVGVTGRDLIVRYTHVPPVPDWRLKLLMQFEINEVSGQSGGEVAADYRRVELPSESDEQTVLVALARNTWLQPRLEAARGAGFAVSGGCPNSVALFNAFLAHGSWKEEETVYLVSIGRENIDMAIARDGDLLFARNMSGGGLMFTEAIMSSFGLKEPKAEKNKVTKGDLTPRAQARYPDSTAEKLANAMQGPAGQLVSMIQSTVMICRAQTKMPDLTVDRLVLTGGGSQMQGMQKYFEANMNVPVEVFDPVAGIDLSNLDEGDREELGENPLDFAVAIGLAETLLQPTSFRLEVLTDKERKKRTFTERTIWALGAAAAALILIVLMFQTRASDIAAYQKANEKLGNLKGEQDRTQKNGQRAMEAESNARHKEVALRSRRLAGAFDRAVLALLAEHHVDNIYLERALFSTEKVSLTLAGMPEFRASEVKEDGSQILRQQVWPTCEVVGRVQEKYTANPGEAHKKYTTGLIVAAEALDIDGFKVEVAIESLDRNQRFRIVIGLKAPKPAASEES